MERKWDGRGGKGEGLTIDREEGGGIGWRGQGRGPEYMCPAPVAHAGVFWCLLVFATPRLQLLHGGCYELL